MESNDLKTKDFWSGSLGARLYRKFAGNYFSKLHEYITKQIIDKNPKDILDVACGPGDFLFYMSKFIPNANLYGTDIAHGMVEYASQKLLGRAKILEARGEKQPFKDNSFDVVSIMMAFHHFPKKEETLREMKRILRPDGILIIPDPVAKSDFQKRFWNFLERIIRVKGYVDHYTESDLRDLSDKVGFSFSCSFIPNMSKRYKICIMSSIENKL